MSDATEKKEEQKALATLGLVAVDKKDLDMLKRLGGDYAPDVPVSYKLLHGELAINRMAASRLIQIVMERVEKSDDDIMILAAARALPNLLKQVTESVRVAAERFEAAESVKALKQEGRGRNRRLNGFPDGPLVVQQITMATPAAEAMAQIPAAPSVEAKMIQETGEQGSAEVAEQTV
jgi:hypothetical protein